MKLAVDTRVNFYLPGDLLQYHVWKSGDYDGYFLSAPIGTNNDIIFTKLGIKDKYEFCRKHTKAKVSEGMFPVIETLEGLSEVVEALFREIQKPNVNFLHNISVNTDLNVKKCTYKLKFSN